MTQAKILSTLALLLVGCTFEPGEWFGTLQPSLASGYVARADRDAGDGWQKLSNDYQVKVTALEMTLGPVALLATAGEGPTGFDPANPPPGYSLCHNGHCHAADGRLVSYQEIEAMVGGGGGVRTVVSLPVDGTVGFLTPIERNLRCDPGCNLDRVTLIRATVPVTAMTVAGLVRDGRDPPRVPAGTPWRWQLAGAALSLETGLALPIDRGHPPVVGLRLVLSPSAALFDGVELSELAAGVISGAAEQRLLQNLREGNLLTAQISRAHR